MPKKSRQSHIPSQVRRRKVRRGTASPNGAVRHEDEVTEAFHPVFAEDPLPDHLPGYGRSPVDTTPQPRTSGRRQQALSQSRDAAVRVIPGQLPTFERAYLVSELRRIATISTALLGLIILLAIALR